MNSGNGLFAIMDYGYYLSGVCVILPLAIAATTASDTAVSSVWLLNVSPYMTPGRITSSGTRPNFFHSIDNVIE